VARKKIEITNRKAPIHPDVSMSQDSDDLGPCDAAAGAAAFASAQIGRMDQDHHSDEN
jgi:hypothetical protein